MSYGTPFTPEEEREYQDLAFRRRRADELDFLNRGVPMTARQQEWLDMQKRQKAQHAAWIAAEKYRQNTAQHSQTYANRDPPYPYAEPEYQYPAQSEGVGSTAAYSESTFSGNGSTFSQPDEPPNADTPPDIVDKAMNKVCGCSATPTKFLRHY